MAPWKSGETPAPPSQEVGLVVPLERSRGLGSSTRGRTETEVLTWTSVLETEQPAA